MKIPAGAKLEKLASTDKTRPVLSALYLRVVESNGERHGFVEGTDSYKLGRIPVELDDDDTEGFITLEALTAARKLKYEHLHCNGSLGAGNALEAFVHFPRPELGTFPNTDQLLELTPATIDGARFTFGVNPRFLLDVAEAMGCETIELEFACTKTYDRGAGAIEASRPSNLRPLTVRPLGRKRSSDVSTDAIGLVMPARV